MDVVAVRRPALDARWVALPVALLAPVLGTAAVVSPPAALVGAVALLFATIAFYDLAAGLALFAIVMFLETAPGMGEGVSAIKLAGLVLVLAALRRSGTPFLLKEHPALAYAAMFLAGWALASTAWAQDVSVAAISGLRLALNVALLFVVFAAVREGRHARWLVWGYLAGGVAAALLGFVDPQEDYENRLAGGIGEPNFLAAMLVPALVFAVFALVWTVEAVQRWALLGCIVLFTVAIVLTQSRGGMVALAVALVTAVLFGGAARRYFLVLVGVAALVGVGYYAAYAPAEALERLQNPGGGTGRADIWSVASQVVDDHPVVGVGAGNFPVVAPEYVSKPIDLQDVYLVVDTPKVAHNTYLGVATDLGVVGLLVFAGVVVGALALARQATKAFMRTGALDLELLSRAVFVSLVGMLTAFVFLSGEYEKHLWLLVGLAVSLYALGRRQRPGAAPSQAPRRPFPS